MRRFLLTVLIVCLTSMVYGGKPTTEGSEFWLTFMNNLDEENALELKIVASSRYDATVSVLNPQTKWTQSFNLSANQIAEFAIPKNQGYTEGAEIVEKRGLLITSTAPISLYAQNYSPHIYDATLVMPVNGLGTQYIIQTFENELFAKECAIVATEDNTRVTITPHARTTAGNAKNVPFQVTLKRGETYQVMSLDENADFSGTRIESDKKVAVFSGHRCINTPTGNRWCDHIVEQQMPTDMWGRLFVVTKTKGQNGDMVMVTASADNTVVKLNGSQVKTLQALESYEFRLTDNSGYIETTQPSAVYLYLEGAERNNMIGDPSSVHISPIEQMLTELTFATFQTNESRTHYINLVTTAAGAAQMLLDGKSIAAEFQPVQGNNALRFAQINVQHGTHTLKTSKDGFVGHVYGLGNCESYAYTFGSATLLLNGQILVDGEPRIDIDYNESRCYKHDITFSVSADAAYNSLKWDLGDGTESTQPTVKHTYAAVGDYTVTLVLTGDDDRDTARTVLHLVETLSDTVYATICDNEKYVWNGTEYTVKGTYKQTLTSAGGCDSIVTLILNVNSTAFSQEKASIPLGSSYRWHWKWFNTAGTYRDTLLTATGCDSICELVLETVDQTETIYDTICYQPSYEFMGQTFSIPSVAGETDDYVNYVLELRDLEECSAKQLVLSISTLAGGDYEIYDTIQQGMTYEFYGQKLTTPGTYTATASSGRGCEQNYTLHLAVLSFPINEEYLAFCHENEIVWRGKTLNKTGVYNDTVFTPAGIEAIYRLYLTDNRSRTEISENTTGPYTLNGITYSESGTYTQTRTNAAGCDSLIILHLGINEKCKINTEESMRICEGQSVKWNGKTYSAAGDYTWSTATKNGCDSIVTLHLAPAETKTTLLEKSICEGDFLRYNGDRLYEAKDYIYTFTSAEGCDSIVTVRISYNQSYLYSEIRVIEEGSSIMWQGETYSQAGTYKKGFIAKNGCDSILELTVIVEKKQTEPTLINAEICEGDFYLYNDQQIATEGDHLFTYKSKYGFDSIVNVYVMIKESYFITDIHTILEGKTIEWEGQTYSEEGYYEKSFVASNGCDSVRQLQLTVIEQPKQYQHVVYMNVSKLWSEYSYFSVYYWDDNSSGYVSMQPLNCDESTYYAILPYGDWENVIFRSHYSYAGNETGTWGDAVEQTVDLKYSSDMPLFYIENNDVKADGHWSTINLQENCSLCLGDMKTLVAPLAGDMYVWDNNELSQSISVRPTESGKISYKCRVYNVDPTVKDNLMPNGDFETVPADTTKFVSFYSEYKNYGFQPNFRYSIYAPYWTPSFDPLNTFAVVCNKITYIDMPSYNLMPHGNYGLYIDGGMDENVSMAWQARSSDYPDLKIIKDSTYVFSYYVLGGGTDNPAVLQFRLSYKNSGGTYTQLDLGEAFQTIGPGISPTIKNDDWVQKKVIFKAPVTSNDITIELYDLVFAPIGNDFALDDICFNLVTDKNKTLVSEYIVELEVGESKKIDEYHSMQEGESYTWNGTTYNQAGDYVFNGKTVAGCDSIVTLHIITEPVIPCETTYESVDVTAEGSYTWELSGETYTESGEYTFTTTDENGCEVVVTLHLTITEPVIPCETTYESVEASAEGSYTWELSGETYTESGEYTFTTTDENGCEVVVTLHLTITEPVIPCETTYESVEASAEGSYTWELSGETYTESGEYTFTTTDENGCEVVVTLHLIITEPVIPCETTYESVDASAEGSYTWELSGETYTESGEYTFTTTDENGCEVVVTLHLTITEPVIPCETTYESVEASAEGSYTWALSGETYTESGEYTFTTTDENGCEVVVTLHLIISTKPRHDESLVAAICEGEEYDFFGDKLTESGSYSNTVETDDEIVDYFLELTVNPAYDKDLYATIEEGEVYMWNEKAYNAEGDYKFEGKTVAGCDSIVTLHLVVSFKPMRNENISASICDGDYYEFYGEKLTKKGTYTHTETGDKEIVNYILTLTVNPVYNKNEYATITDGESYSWNGKKYKEQGSYVYYGSTVAGCDSIVTLHLTVKQSQTIEHSSLSVENSCADERAIVLQLTYDNKPDRIRLTFTGRDKAAGLPDTTITNVTETIVVHHNARAGQYKATAHLYIGNSEVNKTTAEFTLLYPSTVLEQAWNDVVIVLAHNYNGGYDFKAFEWYKNGQLLLGETGSYIYQPLEFGAEYSARLTETNGIQLMTCPLVAEPHEDITLYPTRIRAGQHVNCKVTDEASLYVYDSTGKMILTQQLRQGESELILPLQHGMYIVNIVLNGTSTARQYKLVVSE